MSWALVVLCTASVAIVATLASAVLKLGLPWLDRLALKLLPRQRARFWLAMAALPAALGALALAVSLLPALGVGHDHCLAHGPHHPHLCPHHYEGFPSVWLGLAAALVLAQTLLAAWHAVRVLRLSSRTAHALAEVSELEGGVWVYGSDAPQAFVLGTLRPRVYASRGLLALGQSIAKPALAHERAHARHRDLLWRILCPMLAAWQLPAVRAALETRLAGSQELAADFDAARELADPVTVAEALLALARLERAPAPGLAFTQGNLRDRVFALLNPQEQTAWPLASLLACSAVLLAGFGASHELVHHGLETLLGALS